MAAQVGTIAVKIAAKTAEFTRGVDAASRRLNKLSAAAASVSRKSAIAFTAISAALAVVTKAAGTQLKAERQLQNAFKQTGAALDLEKMKAFAGALQGITLTGDEATIQMAAMLAPFGLLQNDIESLIPPMLDLASATGKSADSIVMALGRALAGGTASALSRYGIELDKASSAAFKLGTVSQRTAIVVDKLANFHGAAAVEASTAAGRTIQLSNAFGDLLEEIGKIVDAPLAATFQNATSAIQAITPLVAGAAGKMLLLGSTITAVVFGLSSFVAVWPKVKPALITLKVAALGITKAMLPIIGILAGIVLMIGAVKLAWDGNLGGMQEKFKSLVSGISSLWDSAIKGLVKGINWLAEKFILFHAMVSGQSPDMAFETLSTFKSDPGSFFVMPDLIGAGSPGSDFNSLKQSWNAGVGVITSMFKKLVPDIASATEKGTEKGAKAGIATAAPKLPPELTTKFFGADMIGSGAQEPTFGKARMDVPTIAVAEKSLSLAVVGFALSVRDSFVSAAASFGTAMINSAGELGGMINTAMEGFRSGGPFGAMAAVFADMVSKTTSFKNTVAHAGEAMNKVVGAFEPLAEAMEPLAGLTNNLVAYFATQLVPVFKALGPVFNVVFQVMRGFMIGVLNIVRTYGAIWNNAIGTLQWVLEKLKLGGVAKALGRVKFNLNGIDRQIAELHNTTADGVRAEIASAAAKDETTKKLKELNQQLSNVPSGFRIDLRRYQSSDGAALSPGQSGGGGGLTAIFNIEALDLEEAARKLDTIDTFKTFTAGARKMERAPFIATRAGG